MSETTVIDLVFLSSTLIVNLIVLVIAINELRHWGDK